MKEKLSKEEKRKQILEDDKALIDGFLSQWPKTSFYMNDLRDMFGLSPARVKNALLSLQAELKVSSSSTFKEEAKWSTTRTSQAFKQTEYVEEEDVDDYEDADK